MIQTNPSKLFNSNYTHY